MTSGAIFALLVVAHFLRFFAEGAYVFRDAWFVLSTLLAAALCIWAFRLLRLAPRT
jgi:hypothetical protein